MIKNKKQYYEYINQDLDYFNKNKNNLLKKIYSYVTKDNAQMSRKFIIQLRKCEYLLNNSCRTTNKKKNLIYDILYIIAKRKLNKYQILLGLEIYENCFDKGLIIYHTGGTVVNPNAKIGENCELYGNNCIGNVGIKGSAAPILGDNIKLGVGCKIIGDIYLANNIKVAAGAVVINSFYEEGIVLAGIPAKKVK